MKNKLPKKDFTFNSSHIPVFGMLHVGGWNLEVFCEQRMSPAAPADTFFVDVVHGRVRVAVVDPALNDMLTGRTRVAAQAWGETYAVLRSVPDPVDALVEANSVVHDSQAQWMGGPMLCVAVVDLHPFEPLILGSVRAGDTEIHAENFSLTGSYATPGTEERLKERKAELGTVGPNPLRWKTQTENLTADDYVTTPLGLVARPRLQTWGTVEGKWVSVATDGVEPLADSRDYDCTRLFETCVKESRGVGSLPHGDRVLVFARWKDNETGSSA